jgi:hypothetical protein
MTKLSTATLMKINTCSIAEYGTVLTKLNFEYNKQMASDQHVYHSKVTGLWLRPDLSHGPINKLIQIQKS